KKTMGFGASLRDNTKETSAVLGQVMPDDLLKYGLIPEFVGRLPVIVPLMALDENDLMRILTEPKNAIVKQYQKFLALDKVELQLTQEALQAAAAGAAKRKTGARGLRTIIEEVLLDVMYEIPSRTDVRRVVVTGSRAMIISGEQRMLTPGDTYRIPPGAAHGARVFEEPTQVIDVWAPQRTDLLKPAATDGAKPRTQ